MPKNSGSETTVIKDNEKILKNNCTIRLEECKKLMQPRETRNHNTQLRIEFNDLHYSVCQKDTKKVILCNVTGHFDPGKLTVLIGPSGAGKTTLLKIILGKLLLNVKGTVTINGIERNKGIFRKQMCYVPQQFALLPFLTTKETLYIAALLKLDVNQTRETIHLIIDEIAKNLGLCNCLDTMAKDLSGGERKRLSLGQEMIIKPSVLLLDEPTSGLDSVASNQLINVLHTMAKANCTVICAIHQPTSQMIMQFDDILVLNQGKCVYCGPQSEILNTFSNAGFVCPQFYNIAEFVLEVITGQRNGDLDNLYKFCRDEYEKSRLSYKYSENDKNLSTTSNNIFPEENSFTFTNNINDAKQAQGSWHQQKALFLRTLICIKRDIIMTKLRFATHIVVGILLGLVFYDFGDDARKVNSNIAFLFFVMMFLFFANAMSAVQMFPNEAAVFVQEYSNNWYYLRSYYSVKILTDLPMQLLCSTCFLITSYYITGQPMELNRIMQAWSVCVLITIFGQTLGILTGTIFNIQIGTFLIPALSIPFLLFAGFFVKLGETSVYLQPLGYISFFRYAFEGLIHALYINRPNLSCLEIYCYLRSPRTILSMIEMPTVPFYTILIILSSWILCLHVIVYAVLYWRTCYSRK